MSLAIDPVDVEAILLGDRWHEIERGTFILDSYEFVEDAGEGFILHGGGQSGVCAIGFGARLR